jgi:hypothetical protein
VRNRRWAVVGVVVAACAALATAACNIASDVSGTTAPTSQADPKDELIAAVGHLKTTSFKATAKLSGGINGDATVDPVAKAGTQRMALAMPAGGPSITTEQRVVGGETYLRVEFKNMRDAPKLPTGWMKVDLAKVDKPQNFTVEDPDPASLAKELFKGLGTVERAGERKFKGTVDLTKATESGIVNDDMVTELKDQAKAVPFEAAVDEKGRIASFRLLVPQRGQEAAETWEVAYSDWGVPVMVEKPANAIPAPAEAYAFLNG